MKHLATSLIGMLVISSGLKSAEMANPSQASERLSWEAIMDHCHFGASYSKAADGSFQVNLGKSNCEESFRFRATQGSSPASAVVVVRYYVIGDDSIYPSSTSRFEVYQIDFLAVVGKRVKRLGDDGEWVLAADKDDTAGQALAIFAAAEADQRSKPVK